MPNSPANAFAAWLDAELAQRGWSYSQLARRAGLSHSMLSRLRAGAPPSWSACRLVAEALGLPPEEVFRQAGLMPPISSDQAEYEQFRHLLAQLSDEDRQELLEIARLKLQLGSSDEAE
jgi:transcriptional regulator with XRE-family HTH domain